MDTIFNFLGYSLRANIRVNMAIIHAIRTKSFIKTVLDLKISNVAQYFLSKSLKSVPSPECEF